MLTKQDIDNPMAVWEAMRTPPKHALKTIMAGRLKGFTDINPQWRYAALTATFGPCGIGWRYEVTRKWAEAMADGQVCVFADINLYFCIGGEWSQAIPGTGGNMLVKKEGSGLYVNDEAYKMAVTDALSAAAKMLGVAADIYMGDEWASKYADNGDNNDNDDNGFTGRQPPPAPRQTRPTQTTIPQPMAQTQVNQQQSPPVHANQQSPQAGASMTRDDYLKALAAKLVKNRLAINSIKLAQLVLQLVPADFNPANNKARGDYLYANRAVVEKVVNNLIASQQRQAA